MHTVTSPTPTCRVCVSLPVCLVSVCLPGFLGVPETVMTSVCAPGCQCPGTVSNQANSPGTVCDLSCKPPAWHIKAFALWFKGTCKKDKCTQTYFEANTFANSHSKFLPTRRGESGGMGRRGEGRGARRREKESRPPKVWVGMDLSTGIPVEHIVTFTVSLQAHGPAVPSPSSTTDFFFFRFVWSGTHSWMENASPKHEEKSRSYPPQACSSLSIRKGYYILYIDLA